MITLATLKDATKQQIFDQVSAHMLEQNKPSKKLEPNGFSKMCAYRGGESGELKCAAGCLIADDEYIPEMDQTGFVDGKQTGSDWSSLIRRDLVTDAHSVIISELQQVHDTVDPVSWKRQLNQLAQRNGLVPIE